MKWTSLVVLKKKKKKKCFSFRQTVEKSFVSFSRSKAVIVLFFWAGLDLLLGAARGHVPPWEAS